MMIAKMMTIEIIIICKYIVYAQDFRLLLCFSITHKNPIYLFLFASIMTRECSVFGSICFSFIFSLILFTSRVLQIFCTNAAFLCTYQFIAMAHRLLHVRVNAVYYILISDRNDITSSFFNFNVN